MILRRLAQGFALALGLWGCGDDGAASSGGDPSGPGSGGEAAGAGGTAAGGAGQAGSGSASAGPACPSFASEVVSTAFGEGQNFGQDDLSLALGPPRGSGCCQGSLDVVSLGNGGSIVLAFGDTAITDGEGADLIVFENAFFIGGDETNVFAELATVEVSADGETWHTFPCSAVEPPYGSCAGWHPVFANADAIEGGFDPLDPAEAGGDAFDLADVGVAEARFVRITDRADLDDPLSGVFDLDAVSVVHGACLE